MNLRRFFRTILPFTFLLMTSYNLSNLPKCSIEKRTNISVSKNLSSRYVSGKGREFIDCVNRTYLSEFQRISRFIPVRDRSAIGIDYSILGGDTTGNYSLKTGRMALDTNKVLYINGMINCHVVSHEIAHALLDRFSREIGNGEWPSSSEEWISEALAIYIGEGRRERAFPQNWPRDSEELTCTNPRHYGVHLVTRLLDKYGGRALSSIIKNPPTRDQILIPSSYQNRIRNILRNSQRGRR